MRIKRTLPVLLVVLAIAAAVVAIVQLRKRAPPEAARLLPGADGFFYINLRWIRTFNATQLPPVSRDPEYQKFVEETGFQFERDLDQAAFAVHYPESWGGTGGAVPEPRFSEVFVGKIDSGRLTTYLKKIASSVDDYHGFEIYNLPIEGRTVRVVVLSYDTVAVSNHPDENVIRGILDRSRKLLFPKPAVLVVSGRYLRALHLRAEAFAQSDSDARAITDKAGAFLTLFHSAEINVGTQGPDIDVKAFFDSLKVERSGDRAIFSATVPPGFIKKVLAEPPADQPAPPKPPAPALPSRPPRKSKAR
jgi:hypothetical protein